MNLSAEQAAAKAHYDALKAKHPYPGGWREGPTDAEKAAWVKLVAKHRNWKPSNRKSPGSSWLWRGEPHGVMPDFSILFHGEKPLHAEPEKIGDYLFIDGRLFMLRRLVGRLVKPGWSAAALAGFLLMRGVPRIPLNGCTYYYDVLAFIDAIVAARTHNRKRLLPAVTALTQGSGSISDKLLAFVESGAE